MNLTKAFDTLHIAALCTVDIKEVFDEVFKNQEFIDFIFYEDKILFNNNLKRRLSAFQIQLNELTKKHDETMNLLYALNKINVLASVIFDSKQILTTMLDYITNEELKSKILKILEEIDKITATN